MFLLAILLALHAPARHQHGAVLAEQVRQLADGCGIDAANRRRPVGVFRRAVALAGQVGRKLRVAVRAGVKEIVILPAVFHQRMGDAEHQRHVGAHVRGNPFHAIAEEISSFRTHRVNADKFFAALFKLLEIADALFVRGVPGNFQRVERVGAPQHYDIAVLQHQRPAGLLLIDFVAAHHIRHDHLRGPRGVIAQMTGVAAREAHIALQQRGGFMQYAVGAPAVGACENRRRAVAFANAPVLLVNQTQRLVPADTHKLILPAHALRAIRRGEKPFTRHRVAHTCFAVHLVRYGGLQGIRVARRQRALRREHGFTVGLDNHGPPVGGGNDAF